MQECRLLEEAEAGGQSLHHPHMLGWRAKRAVLEAQMQEANASGKRKQMPVDAAAARSAKWREALAAGSP